MKKLFLFILACCTGVFVYSAVVQNQFVTNQVANIANGPGVVGPIYINGALNVTDNIPIIRLLTPAVTNIITSGGDEGFLFKNFKYAVSYAWFATNHANIYLNQTNVLTISNNISSFKTEVDAPTFVANSAGGGSLTLTEPTSGQTVTEYASGTNFFVQTISTNSGGALNTNTFNMGNNVNGNLFRFQGTNNTDLIKMDQNGNLTMSNLTGIITVTNFSTGGSWKSPTNAPTANQVLTASSTGGDTKWAAAGGAAAVTSQTWVGNWQASPGGVNTFRYGGLFGNPSGGDSGSPNNGAVYFSRGGYLTNLNFRVAGSSFYPSTTNVYMAVAIGTVPGTLTDTNLSCTLLGQSTANPGTNSGTLSVQLPVPCWVNFAYTNSIASPGAKEFFVSVEWVATSQ